MKGDLPLQQPPIGKPVLFGAAVLIVFIASFIMWSFFSALDSAAMSQGTLAVESHRKTIQHLEGGIIQKIHVKDGSVVKKGDPLVTLDKTSAQTNLELLNAQAIQLQAEMARLIAQRDQEKKITWPDRLLKQKDTPQAKKIMQGELDAFLASRKNMNDQFDILNLRIAQHQNEIKSIESQVLAKRTQIKYIQKEIEAVKYLDKLRLVEKPRLYALQREEAKLKGDIGERVNMIERAKQRIGEAKKQIVTIKSGSLSESLQQLREARRNLVEVLKREELASERMKRIVIAAPQSGTVIGLQKHTVGGVVSPGEAILEIVPKEDLLIIESKISPYDIDVVRRGLRAKVKFAALKQRNAPVYIGTVVHVSADSFMEQNTNNVYYKAKIVLDKDQLENINKDLLYPGMPIEVMIITQNRSPFDYFVTPIFESFNRAFREQ